MAEILKKLQKARLSYYETGTSIMTDDEYDVLVEEFRKLHPDHAFFSKPGPTPSKGKILLPYPMSSLTKIKPESWLNWKVKGNAYVISEKLDGISALWCSNTKKLYLRGDGETGQDVSHVIPHIKGLQSKIGSWIVRGELIIPSAEVTNTLARNWTNGILHQDEPKVEDMKKIRFVAYQVLEPKGLTRSQQFAWLMNQGFEVAWNTTVTTLNLDLLSTLFKNRRTSSTYTCDGIVIGTDTVPLQASIQEPTDAVAYKEISEDQCKITKVINVEWNPSKTGLLVPRLKLEPVVIGEATIQFCTAFNAKFVQENKIGKGTIIKLRRSGDVIPVIHSIIACSEKADMPPEYEWDATNTHAKIIDPSQNTEVQAKLLVHSLTTFGLEGFREASALSLCLEGITSIPSIIKAGKNHLQEILGKVLGQRLFDSQELMSKASFETWLVAAPCWPKGLGSTKLIGLYNVEPDITKWGPQKIKGLSSSSILLIKEHLPQFIAWKKSIEDLITIQVNAKPIVVKTITTPTKGMVCMSGFRDADLKKKLEENGYVVHDSVTKTTAALFVADISKLTTKIESAKKHGIPIYDRSMIDKFFATVRNE